MSTQITVSMKALKELLKSVSPEVVVCIRGRHAVGKSEAVAQVAQEMGLPLVMRRLSQMTEGDMLGIPNMTKTKKGKDATSFNPCEWFLEACDEPCLVFLDERNRALEAVKQSVFEVCDSRAFYGHKLHPESRVVIAENVGEHYQVQQCDPAEVSRCVTVELNPTPEEWIEYAKDKCHQMTIDYIRSTNFKALEHLDKNYEPNKKYPDRRAWFKFDQEAQRNGYMDEPGNFNFYVMACGFLGTEVGSGFVEFCKKYDRQVSALDVLTNWEYAKKKLGKSITNQTFIDLGTKIADYLNNPKKKITLTKPQAEELAKFMRSCPAEIALQVYVSLTNDHKNLMIMSPLVGMLIASQVNGEKEEELIKKRDASLANKPATKKK